MRTCDTCTFWVTPELGKAGDCRLFSDWPQSSPVPEWWNEGKVNGRASIFPWVGADGASFTTEAGFGCNDWRLDLAASVGLVPDGAGEWECPGCGELWRGTIHFCESFGRSEMTDSAVIVCALCGGLLIHGAHVNECRIATLEQTDSTAAESNRRCRECGIFIEDENHSHAAQRAMEAYRPVLEECPFCDWSADLAFKHANSKFDCPYIQWKEAK